MEFRVLGPVEVCSADGSVPSIARKPALLLTAGLVEAGQVVSLDRLVDAVWGDDPPTTAAKLVQSYVAGLRRVLHRHGGREVIVTRPGGYLFQPEAGRLDLERFEHLLRRGRTEVTRGDDRAAVQTLQAALDLWRGPALGSPDTPALQAEATRLEELRQAAVETLVGARLATGPADEQIGELSRLVAVHPLRERLRGLLMTALERCGRRAEALQVYRDGYRQLRTELGIAPGPELQKVHARLLAAEAPPAVPAVPAGPVSRLPDRVPARAPDPGPGGRAGRGPDTGPGPGGQPGNPGEPHEWQQPPRLPEPHGNCGCDKALRESPALQGAPATRKPPDRIPVQQPAPPLGHPVRGAETAQPAVFRRLRDAGDQAFVPSGTGAPGGQSGRDPGGESSAASDREPGRLAAAVAGPEPALAGCESAYGTTGAAEGRCDPEVSLLEQGCFQEALTQLRAALTSARALRCRRGEGMLLRAISLVHRAEGVLAAERSGARPSSVPCGRAAVH